MKRFMRLMSSVLAFTLLFAVFAIPVNAATYATSTVKRVGNKNIATVDGYTAIYDKDLQTVTLYEGDVFIAEVSVAPKAMMFSADVIGTPFTSDRTNNGDFNYLGTKRTYSNGLIYNYYYLGALGNGKDTWETAGNRDEIANFKSFVANIRYTESQIIAQWASAGAALVAAILGLIIAVPTLNFAAIIAACLGLTPGMAEYNQAMSMSTTLANSGKNGMAAFNAIMTSSFPY